ncbi:hypothetical protein [Sphingomonas sp.]|uniref:hypothetical protein n=1 Tax=Sphingomonas sp. TaxID=28214 RepID=UPI0025ED86B1|nr:hypothetical protein [Sphingomonas sp.]
MSGRPLRFLGVVLGGWVAVRVMLLSQPVPGVGVATKQTPKPPIAHLPRTSIAWDTIPPAAPFAAPRPRSFTVATAHPFVASPWQRHPGDPDRVALALLGLTRLGPSEPVGVVAAVRDDPATTPALAFPKPAPGASRLSGSAWLIARSGSGLGQSPLGGQLGGSQAGIRVAYAIDRQRRVALVGRVATPLAGPGREAAVGVEWQPTRAPVRIVAEQRLAIDGGGGGPAIGVVGGVGPVPIGNFRLEAYGQAGVIGRGRGVGYADGAVRIDHPIAKRHGVTLAAGLGAWGAAQPGAERIDVGPVLAATVPIAERRIRVALEWRARVGGRAAPGSGLALSIGGDF